MFRKVAPWVRQTIWPGEPSLNKRVVTVASKAEFGEILPITLSGENSSSMKQGAAQDSLSIAPRWWRRS